MDQRAPPRAPPPADSVGAAYTIRGRSSGDLWRLGASSQRRVGAYTLAPPGQPIARHSAGRAPAGWRGIRSRTRWGLRRNEQLALQRRRTALSGSPAWTQISASAPPSQRYEPTAIYAGRAIAWLLRRIRRLHVPGDMGPCPHGDADLDASRQDFAHGPLAWRSTIPSETCRSRRAGRVLKDAPTALFERTPSPKLPSSRGATPYAPIRSLPLLAIDSIARSRGACRLRRAGRPRESAAPPQGSALSAGTARTAGDMVAAGLFLSGRIGGRSRRARWCCSTEWPEPRTGRPEGSVTDRRSPGGRPPFVSSSHPASSPRASCLSRGWRSSTCSHGRTRPSGAQNMSVTAVSLPARRLLVCAVGVLHVEIESHGGPMGLGRIFDP
jgi:hypothetical protein